MNSTLELVLIAVIILLITYWLVMHPKENFNDSIYNSTLEKDMDYIKDRKGYTLNDYILGDHIIYGKGIESPF